MKMVNTSTWARDGRRPGGPPARNGISYSQTPPLQEPQEPMPQQSASPAHPDSGAVTPCSDPLGARRTPSCLRREGAFALIRQGCAGRLTAAVCLA